MISSFRWTNLPTIFLKMFFDSRSAMIWVRLWSFDVFDDNIYIAMTLLELNTLEPLILSLSTCHWWFTMILQVRYNMISFSHLRRDSKLLTSRALNTSSAVPWQYPAPLFRITCQIPNLYLDCILFMGSLEICFVSTVSLSLIGMHSFTVPRHGVSTTLSFRRDPLHHDVVNDSLDSWIPFTASSVITSSLHTSTTRSLNAMIANSVSLFNVIPR